LLPTAQPQSFNQLEVSKRTGDISGNIRLELTSFMERRLNTIINNAVLIRSILSVPVDAAVPTDVEHYCCHLLVLP